MPVGDDGLFLCPLLGIRKKRKEQKMETIVIEEKRMPSFLDPSIEKTLKLCQRGCNFYVMNEEGYMHHIPNVHDVEKARWAFTIYKPL